MVKGTPSVGLASLWVKALCLRLQVLLIPYSFCSLSGLSSTHSVLLAHVRVQKRLTSSDLLVVVGGDLAREARELRLRRVLLFFSSCSSSLPASFWDADPSLLADARWANL